MARSSSTLMRGRVTRVTGRGVFVEVAEIGVGYELGPCQSLVPRDDLDTGDRVLVGSVQVREDVVVLGRLH